MSTIDRLLGISEAAAKQDADYKFQRAIEAQTAMVGMQRPDPRISMPAQPSSLVGDCSSLLVIACHSQAQLLERLHDLLAVLQGKLEQCLLRPEVPPQPMNVPQGN